MAKRSVEMNSYIQRFDGEWVDVTCERFLACCDCGLVHREQYRIITSDETYSTAEKLNSPTRIEAQGWRRPALVERIRRTFLALQVESF